MEKETLEQINFRSKKIVVTRHEALVDYLEEIGLIKHGDYTLITHATIEDIKDKDVIGVLPLSLACEAHTVTEVPLTLPQELRGQELSIEDVRKYAGKPRVYTVTETLFFNHSVSNL